ncbi:MAG: alanine racemase [Pseudomonadales bacterium]
MRRRSLLLGSAALSAAATSGTLLWSPQARTAAISHGHNAYFSALNELLKRDGPGRPVLIVDTARMAHNTDQLVASVGSKKTYRVVVKSLPSVPLLQQVMARAKTRALMVFHQPFINTIAEKIPDADILIGKPMPVAAARTFYGKLKRGRFNPATQLQWLVDSQERLLQYQALAKQLGIRLRINFEIDVGLRRGGLGEPAQLSAALATIEADPEHLVFAGLMGYEPHLTGLQATLKHPAVQQVLAAYWSFLETAQASGYSPEALTLNGAGSHTLKIYEKDRLMNDLSAGSGVVKPTDFDTHHLRQHQPALFIATPILKRYNNNPFTAEPSLDAQRLYYIYGGAWKANMVSPSPIGSAIYESTNQSPISTSAAIDLQVDDYMFLRPTQSEFVMLQFGDLLTVDDGQIAGYWPVFQQTS